MIVEAARPVPWTKPEDLPFDSNLEKPLPKLGGQFENGFHVAFTNGVVVFLSNTISPHLLRALITRNGGDSVSDNQLQGRDHSAWQVMVEGFRTTRSGSLGWWPRSLTAACGPLPLHPAPAVHGYGDVRDDATFVHSKPSWQSRLFGRSVTIIEGGQESQKRRLGGRPDMGAGQYLVDATLKIGHREQARAVNGNDRPTHFRA